MQREFIATKKDWVRKALEEKDKAAYWQQWKKELTPSSELFGRLSLLPDPASITRLPALSFMLHIPFRLRAPYISKDERDFHLLDNPLRKEKVFQAPLIASTTWKGALRAALWQLDYKEEHDVTMRILGNPRGCEEHQAGRLYFYPSFFDKIGLEVINPHSRETGVGERGPILIECVPGGTTAELILLYVPFGPIEQSEESRCIEVAQDLEVLAKGIQAMFSIYGFGAKTSSGFGVAKDRLAGEGKLTIKAELADVSVSAVSPSGAKKRALPRYLESPTHLHTDLRREDGSVISEKEYRALIESRGQKYAKKDKQLYAKARAWWERKGRKLREASPEEWEPEAEEVPTQSPPLLELAFLSLSELSDLVVRVASQLGEEKE